MEDYLFTKRDLRALLEHAVRVSTLDVLVEPAARQSSGQELLLTYTSVDHNPEALKQSYNRDLGQIESYLRSVQDQVRSYNAYWGNTKPLFAGFADNDGGCFVHRWVPSE